MLNRAIVWFTEILEILRKVYGDQTLSRTTVCEQFTKFRDGRESLEDDKCTGWPSTSRTDVIIIKIHKLMKKDRCIRLREYYRI